MKINSSLKSLVLTLTLAAGFSLRSPAQQATNSAANPFITALQSTIINTNSAFFNSPGLEIRALTQTTIANYESVLSGTYYWSNNIGIGAEIVNGALNVVDSGYFTLEYGIPYYNVKLVPVAGIGYDLLNRGPAVELGTRLEVALSQNMFADTEGFLQVPFRDFTGNNISGTFRLGIGWKF